MRNTTLPIKKLILLVALIVSGIMTTNAQDTDAGSTHDPAEWVTGTLPVLYVNTENGEDITSKEVYLQGSYYLDAMGLDGYESIGSAQKPLALQIRGRGNATWTEIKKPFRLKLDKKAALLGMNKSKHFVLLANANEIQCRYDLMGFELSRRLGMAWTPTMKPIELVINGDYRGFYYLCENIRVDADRVNIIEQDDEETDLDAVTGGWLIEIDNYEDDSQILFPDHGHGGDMRITHHSPEILSDEQNAYLVDLLTAVDNAIYGEESTSTAFTELIDLDALARFYVLQEIMDNGESFSGSCYWHKDRGSDKKIVFGPVWDFGSSFCHWKINYESFIYNNTPSYSIQRWIGDLAKFRIFQMKVRDVWDEFKRDHWSTLFNVYDEQEALINDAINRDRERWPEYNITTLLHYRYNAVKNYITTKVNWLDTQWQPFNTFICGSFTGGDKGKLAMNRHDDGSFSITIYDVTTGDMFHFVDYDGSVYGAGDNDAVSENNCHGITLDAEGKDFVVNGSGDLTFTLSPDMRLSVSGWGLDGVTLNRALAGEDGDVKIVDNVAVVVAGDNYSVVSDGNGNWLKVTGQEFVRGDVLGRLKGTIHGLDLSPVMAVSEMQRSEDAEVAITPNSIVLANSSIAQLTSLKANEVVQFTGCYNAATGELCAYGPNKNYGGFHFAMGTGNMTGSLSANKQQRFVGVVTFKAPWEAPAGAPARVAIDDEQAFANLEFDAFNASVPTGVTVVNTQEQKEPEGIYNVNGQQVNRTERGIYIIRYTDGTATKVQF